MPGLSHQGISWAFILALCKLIRTVPATNEIARVTEAGTTAKDPWGWQKGSGAVKGLRKRSQGQGRGQDREGTCDREQREGQDSPKPAHL